MGAYGVGQPARQYLEVFAALVHKAFPDAGVYVGDHQPMRSQDWQPSCESMASRSASLASSSVGG